uniref:Uncharacterized protein n=1 Tax=Romanomermis culicivorax TaxID=13658 RepID=A0A915K8D5_ROMCU
MIKREGNVLPPIRIILYRFVTGTTNSSTAGPLSFILGRGENKPFLPVISKTSFTATKAFSSDSSTMANDNPDECLTSNCRAVKP